MNDRPSGAKNNGLGLVVFSGDFSRVHYALVMASAAAATNRAVTVFFTMEATKALLAEDGEGNPGWQGLDGSDGSSPAEKDQDFADKGVARFEELLAACGELGVTFMVCEMGLRALGMEETPLRPDIKALKGGVVSFLSRTDDGKIVFI